MNSEPLRGRVAVVTGASSGIGAAVTRALAYEGVHTALAARREDALLEVRARLQAGEVRTLTVPTDVTDRQQVKSLVARTEEELGPVAGDEHAAAEELPDAVVEIQPAQAFAERLPAVLVRQLDLDPPFLAAHAGDDTARRAVCAVPAGARNPTPGCAVLRA